MKGKSIDKKKKPATPVILIDESNDLTNTVIISKMINGKENSSNIKPSSNVFTGGFKYRPQENASKRVQQQHLSHLMAASKIDKMTVYDEFGLVNDSIGKKKYRDNVKQSTINVNNPPTMFSNDNPWKKERKEPVSNNFVNPDYYQISNLKDREQVAVHVKSSLQEINLDNIQAKIQAHRMSLKSVQEQYNMAKGKSIVQPQSQYKDKLRFNIDVDRQYKDMQPQKVYQFIKQKQNQMDRPKQQLILQQMWEAKKKNDPKLAEYEFKYQQYLVEKEAKKMIGSVVKDKLFTWDKNATKEELDKRKMAKQRKSKEKYYAEVIQSKVLSKVYGNVGNSTVEIPQQHFTHQSIDIEQKIASKDDKFISKFVMAEVDLDKRGTISKDELIDYLSSKQHLIKGYHIDLKWLHTDLDNFETKRKGMLNQQEVAQFLATLDKIHHPEIVLKEVENKDKSKISKIVQKEQNSQKVYSSYFKQHRKKFESIFKIIDINEDRIIKREEFIENIYLDADCNIILDKTAIKLNIIDKNITFRQIISFILDDYRKEKNQKLKKSKEYITLQRFQQYFEIAESLDLNSLDKNSNEKLKKDNASRQIEMYDIEPEYLLILKDIFSTIPRVYQDYIVTNDFVSIALKDPQVLAIYEQLCRIQSVETSLPVQTIRSTLIRMTKECDQYATWEILKTYFSRRGRPLDWDYDLIEKKKEIRQKKLKVGSQIAKQNLSIIKDGDQDENIKNFVYSNANKKTLNSSSPQKYTIPKPFNITDQRNKKQVAKQISSQQKQIQQLKNKFKAKPVNKDILAPKPELIQGKIAKSDDSVIHNYENYENDRIQRVLKKAQQDFELAQTIKEIKHMSEIKAKDIKIDLNKKLNDVLQEQKRNKSKIKPKPTVPVSTNLYPQDPKEQGQRKIQKYKKQLEKQTLAEKMRQDLKKEVKDRAKEKNQNVKKTALQQRKKEKQEEKEISKLNQDSYKPKITKYQQSEEEKEALRLQKEERQRKKQEQMTKIMEIQQLKKQKRLEFVKKQNKLEIAGLEDEQILNKIDEVDLEDLLLSQEEKMQFRKEYNFKDKTRRQIKDRFSGLAGRQKAMMQAQQKRLAEEKRKLKEQKQQKVVKEKIQSAKEMKEQITSTLNMDPNFHRSKALRRYRALMEDKQPLPEYDTYSVVGEKQRSQI